MTENPKEVNTLPETQSPKPRPEPIKNIAAIKGYQDIPLDLQRMRANQAEELAADLEKIEKRPLPLYFDILAEKSPEYQKRVENYQQFVQEVNDQKEKSLAVADIHANEALSRLVQVDPRWKPVLGELKKSGSWTKNGEIYSNLSMAESFAEVPRLETMSKGEYLYHHRSLKITQDPGEAQPHYFSKESLPPGQARKVLALPPYNDATIVEAYKTKDDIRVLRGKVAARYGQDGGGEQIYIPDSTKLERVQR